MSQQQRKITNKTVLPNEKNDENEFEEMTFILNDDENEEKTEQKRENGDEKSKKVDKKKGKPREWTPKRIAAWERCLAGKKIFDEKRKELLNKEHEELTLNQKARLSMLLDKITKEKEEDENKKASLLAKTKSKKKKQESDSEESEEESVEPPAPKKRKNKKEPESEESESEEEREVVVKPKKKRVQIQEEEEEEITPPRKINNTNRNYYNDSDDSWNRPHSFVGNSNSYSQQKKSSPWTFV